MPIHQALVRQEQRKAELAAEQREAAEQLKGVLAKYAPLIQQSLPKHLNGDRMARLALNVIRKTPDLLLCTPESFVGSILSMAALGLEIDVAGESYLVPYGKKGQAGKEATPIVGYQGWTKLFYQHPLAADLSAERVHEADEFDYEKGTSPYIRHRPKRVPVKDRGPVIFFYSVATLANGRARFEVMTPDEVAVLRGGKVGPSGDIKDPQQWMERKTVLRQVLKVSPRSLMLNRALEVEERPGSEITKTTIEQIDGDRAMIEGGQRPPVQQDEPAEDDGERYANAEESAQQPDPWVQQ